MRIAESIYRVYPALVALGVLSLLVAILVGKTNSYHSAGILLLAFGVFWYYRFGEYLAAKGERF